MYHNITASKVQSYAHAQLIGSYVTSSIPEDVTYLEHLTCNHQELELSSVEKIMELLISASPDLITVGYRLSSMPPS